MATNNQSFNQDQVIASVEKWFQQFPPLPPKWKESLVTIVPWVALIFGILGILGSITAFGVLTSLSPLVIMNLGLAAAGGGIVSLALGLVSSILLLLAFSGTKQRKYRGWTFLFWSSVVGLISAVISFSITGVVFSFVAFYALFQIKSFYKK